jgi:hypothetical protein
MATNKNRTSSRKKTPISNSKGYVSRSIITWRYLTRSYVIVCISLIVLIATMLAVYLGYTSYIANEAQASDKERTAFSTVSKVIARLSPDLESLSLDGAKWTVDKHCIYTEQALHEGDRSCHGYLTGKIPYISDSDMKYSIARIESVLDGYPQYFRPVSPVEYPNTIQDYFGRPARGGHVLELENIACSNSYTIYERGELTVSFGCGKMPTRAEYYPPKP